MRPQSTPGVPTTLTPPCNGVLSSYVARLFGAAPYPQSYQTTSTKSNVYKMGEYRGEREVPAMGRGTCLGKRRGRGDGTRAEDGDIWSETVRSGAVNWR